MADNITLNSGSGGASLAADDIASVWHQRVKVQYGVDGAATDVSDSNPLPVDDAGGSLTVDNADLTTIAGAIKSEDAAHVTGDAGIPALAVQQTADTALAGTDGDYAPMQLTSSGHLKVFVKNNSVPVTDNAGSLTVDNAGTFATQIDGAALTALQLIDNPVKVDDAAFTEDTDSVSVAGVVRDDEVGSTAVTSTDGDAGPLRSNKFGMLKTTELWDATSEPKFAVIDAATSGDNTLVAAAGAGIKIRVLALFLVSAGTVTARFESGASGTALSGQMNLVANSGFVLPYNPAGWFETADNTLLNLELSAAISVDGALTYVQV